MHACADTIYVGIEDGPGGGRTMELIDPSSNRLRFLQQRTTG